MADIVVKDICSVWRMCTLGFRKLDNCVMLAKRVHRRVDCSHSSTEYETNGRINETLGTLRFAAIACLQPRCYRFLV